ncbi:MAG: ABC transporter ATP-binding protein [Caldivirga sp.]
MPVAVEFINVTKRFGKLTAVENINLKVNDGEVIALVGPNGAGKTTLLRMAAGVLLPDTGKVLIHGIEAHRAEAKRHVGFMTPMDRGVYWRISALDNLVFFGTLYGLSIREAKRRGMELLKVFGLADRANDWVATYSTGMMRRLELARAMMHDPDILLLDEPTSGIDVDGKRIILEHISRLKGSKTIIMASHDPQEIELADRVVYLNRNIIDTLPALKIVKVLVKGSLPPLDGYRVINLGNGTYVIHVRIDKFDELMRKLTSMDGNIKIVDLDVEVAVAERNARIEERVNRRERGGGPWV